MKRKREEGRPVPLNKPLRQVPGLSGGSDVASKSNSFIPPIPNVVIHTKKPIRIRRVVDRPIEAQAVETRLDSDAEIRDSPDIPPCESEDKTDGSEPLEPPAEKEKTPSSSPKRDSDDIPADPPPDEAPPRTKRSRKVVTSAAVDVFGGHQQTKPPRKRTNGHSARQHDQLFMGMSAVALKALTTSNTERNQRYLAAKLETDIIRKEGVRPESPTVKIRTILQRQQEEKSQQRKERAQRRARRSEDGNYSDTSVMDVDSEFGENDSPLRKRHKRGPGEEEDYETPVRARLGARGLDDDDGEVEASENARRVKWDRGLFTTIYLDEVELGTRQRLRDSIATKGCLAPAAKV